MADKPTKGSRAETAAGAGALAAGVGIRPVAFKHYRNKEANLQARKAAAVDYLSQGGKAKRDPSKKNLNTTKKKAALREVNVVGRELKHLKPPTTVNRTKVWLPLTAGGAALAWHGGRKEFQKPKETMAKKADRKDFDAAAAGTAGGVLAHQGTGLGFTLKRMKDMDRHNSDERKAVKEYNKTAIPKGGMKTGDPQWKTYWRNYPTHTEVEGKAKPIGGAKIARTLARTHGGKTGIATLAATGAVGGAAGVGISRHNRKKIAKREMSDTELNRRKKLQGSISRTTSTLGLGGLGLLGASMVARKNPARLKQIQSIHPKLKKVTPDQIKGTAQNVALVSGGIGGLGGYNFASYTNAEAKRKKEMKKSFDPSPFEDGCFGVEGNPVPKSVIESAFETDLR